MTQKTMPGSVGAWFSVLAFLAFLAGMLPAGEAVAHGRTIDLDAYCRMINDRGGIKLPTDPKWHARYNARHKRWECIRPQSTGFNRISPEVAKPLNLIAACRKWGSSRKVHYHEGTNVHAESSVHCGKYDGTVKQGGGGGGAPSKLVMCNTSSHDTLYAAYAYWDRRPGRKGWTSEGWWTIPRGECKQTTVPGGPSGRPYSGDIYIYGENNRTTWSGQDARFCIQDGAAFSLTTADKMRCGGGNLKKVSMYKTGIRPGRNTWNFR